MSDYRVLINVPDLRLIGGVSNYYSALKGRFSKSVDYVVYGSRGKSEAEGGAGLLWRILKDNLNCMRILVQGKHDLLHLNPSLEPKGFFRDAITFFLAHWLLRRKVLVFWRGWDLDFQQQISKKHLWLLRLTYLRSDAMIVLAKQFRSQLRIWGYQGPVFTETTVMNENLVKGLDVDSVSKKYEQQVTNLLFLGRVERNKGIFEILSVYDRLKVSNPHLRLQILGDGSVLDEVKQDVERRKLDGVSIHGFVKGKAKIQLLQEAHIYLFPSTHAEGLPNSVLEAMGCGMPVLTTANAGIKDFFVEPDMGFVLDESALETSLEKALSRLLGDRSLQASIAQYNHTYALDRFSASRVIQRLEAIHEQTVLGEFNDECLAN